jgi:hypothetical protein
VTLKVKFFDHVRAIAKATRLSNSTDDIYHNYIRADFDLMYGKRGGSLRVSKGAATDHFAPLLTRRLLPFKFALEYSLARFEKQIVKIYRIKFEGN